MNIVEHNGQRFELVRVDDKTVVSRPLPPESEPAERAPPVETRRKPGRPRKAD